VTKRFQLVGIGNAMVDVLSHCEELYDRIGPATEMSGGSAANTIAGFAHLGGRAAYVGKVKDDQLGRIFAHDLRAQGVTYEVPFADKDHAHETGRCIVLVTPDGERSMNTYLGVTEHLSPADIDEAMMADAEWIFLEGYRFDGPESHEAFAKAINHAAFARMLREDVDLLFANRAEIEAMYDTDFDSALEKAAAEVETVVCTESAHGAHILAGGARIHCPAVPTKVVDATGAGDLFAGAFLWGLVEGHDLGACGTMANIAGSEVISHLGARVEADLKAKFRAFGLEV